MSKNILGRLTLVAVAAALFLSGCGGDSRKQEKLRGEAEDMVNEAYMAQDYRRIIELVDSLEPLGNLSEGKAHNDLKKAYDQLEVTTTAKERMESELRIARDIQMSMVPNVFPSVEGLDMYASMTPAEGQYTFLDVKETNAPIGLWPDLEFVGEELDLPSGSMMLLYTDGLNEAENRQQEQYGEDRIIQLMTSHAPQGMRDMVEVLKADVDQFRDGAEQNDDLTMLAFRVCYLSSWL